MKKHADMLLGLSILGVMVASAGLGLWYSINQKRVGCVGCCTGCATAGCVGKCGCATGCGA